MARKAGADQGHCAFCRRPARGPESKNPGREAGAPCPIEPGARSAREAPVVMVVGARHGPGAAVLDLAEQPVDLAPRRLLRLGIGGTAQRPVEPHQLKRDFLVRHGTYNLEIPILSADRPTPCSTGMFLRCTKCRALGYGCCRRKFCSGWQMPRK